jgi:Uma2 family endonuclease
MSAATAPPVPTPTPPATSPRPLTYGLDPSAYRFTVEQYHQMIRAGVLTKDDKVELLEGYLVLKMATDPAHDGTIDLVKVALEAVLPRGWFLRIQQTVALPDSNPQPDIAAVRGGPRSFVARHPGPADVGVVVEIANTSLPRDVTDKARVYARAGIPAYWVIDVANAAVEVFTQPSGPTAAPAYASHQTVRPPAAVPLTLDGTAVGPVPAADLLP